MFNDLIKYLHKKKFLKYTSIIFPLTVIILSYNLPVYGMQNPTGAIQGTIITDENKPLEGANIYIPELKLGAVSDRNGYFIIKNIPPGEYLISFSFIGYSPQSRRIKIESGKTINLDISLKISIIAGEAITITGTPRATDVLETAQDISVIGPKELEKTFNTSISHALEKIPGIHTIATGVHVGKPVIRGLSGNRIRVLYDGISMDHQQYGVRHLPNVEPLNAGRIEVVRGPSSVLYGSDAIGGVVNILPHTVNISNVEAASFGGELTTQYYSNNDMKVGQIKLEGASKGFKYHGTLTTRSAGNFHTPNEPTYAETGKNGDPKFTGEIPYTDFKSISGNSGLGYYGSFGNISIHYDRWGLENNFLLPNGNPIGLNLENDIIRLDGLFAASSFIIKPSFNFQRNLRQANEGGKARDKLPEAISVDILRNVYTGRLEIHHKKVSVFSGICGMEYTFHNQDTRGKEPLTAAAEMTNFAAFLFEEAKIKSWSLFVGARIDRRSINSEPDSRLKLPDYDSGETNSVLTQKYTAVSGSIGSSYRINESTAIAGNIGRGFRVPDIFELHAYGEHGGVAAFQIGNPNMEPEISLNMDLSIRWRSNRFKGTVTGYYNNIDNYIFLMNNPDLSVPGNDLPVYTYAQTDATLKGVEIGINYGMLSWFQIQGTYSKVDGKNDITKELLPLMPADKLNLGVTLSKNKLRFLTTPFFKFEMLHAWNKKSAGVYEPFSQFDFSIPFGTASTDAYTIFNIESGFGFRFSGQNLSLHWGIRNLLDEGYRDFLDTYKGYAMSPGRDFYIKLTFHFSKIRR